MSKEGIIITGGTGFIGVHTQNALEELEHDLTLFNGDIRKSSDWEEQLVGGEVIYLLAGVRTETLTDLEVNAQSIDSMFEAAFRINKLPKKLILVSSQAVYMSNIPPFKELDLPKPTTVYGKSKLLAEQIAQEWSQRLNIPLVILRYSTVLGRGIRETSRMSGPLMGWTKAALACEPLKVFQDGNQSRDYIHVSDVVSANILGINLPDGIYNVGGGVPTRLLELANWVKEFTNSDSEIIVLGGEPTQTDPKKMFSDTSRLLSRGWKPQKSAREAVAEFVASLG